jgi:hypothetical protein
MQCKVITSKVIKPAPANDLPWIYPINKLKQDSLTSGIGDTVRIGWIFLFNYRSNDQHHQQLPGYVASFKLKNAANVHLNLPEKGDKVLVDTETNDRYFGAIITQDPKPYFTNHDG